LAFYVMIQNPHLTQRGQQRRNLEEAKRFMFEAIIEGPAK